MGGDTRSPTVPSSSPSSPAVPSPTCYRDLYGKNLFQLDLFLDPGGLELVLETASAIIAERTAFSLHIKPTRMYYKKQGRRTVVLLAGGDKRTQSDDVKTALRLTRNL